MRIEEKRIGEQYFFNLATPGYDLIQEIANNPSRYKFYYDEKNEIVRLYNKRTKTSLLWN